MRHRSIAFVELLLIAPAALFMAALVARYLHYNPAQHLIDWYAHRMWTLWLLLLALPLCALISGLAALGIMRSPSLWKSPGAIHATTLAAACILVIVVLHMAAN